MKKKRPYSYWLRHQKEKCECGGYEFPHRKTGGGCYHSKRPIEAACCRARRQGMSSYEVQLIAREMKEREEGERIWASESPAYQGDPEECPF